MGGDPRFELIDTRRFATLESRELGDRRLVFISSPCTYTRRIIEAAFSRKRKRFAITSSQADAQIQWADYEDLDWDIILEGNVRANSYLIRKGLSRKAQLCHYLNKFTTKNRSSVLVAAVPESMSIETWEVYEDDLNFLGAKFDRSMVSTVSQRQRLEWALSDAKLKMESAEAGSLWILKPSLTNKGAEIFLIEDFATLSEAVSDWPDVREWVLQRYVADPLLFRRAKFHLRVYVLAVGDLTVYVYEGILLLCSHAPYDRADLSNTLAHITNTAKQAESNSFVEEDCVFLLDDLCGELVAQGSTEEQAKGRVAKIRDDIRAVTCDLFRALHGERTVFSPLPNCFELFGLDFLVDEDYQVYLLEVNPGPDFKQTGDRLSTVIEGLIDGCIDIALAEEGQAVVDKRFSKVYEDTHKGANFHGRAGGPGAAGQAGSGMRLFA